VVVCCEYVDEPVAFKIGGQFLDWLCDYHEADTCWTSLLFNF
jgi:hypothetical protein